MDEAIWIIYLLNDTNTIYKVVNDPRLDLHTLLDLGSNMHIILDLRSIEVVEKPLSFKFSLNYPNSTPRILYMGYLTLIG
jgi:hypothetical protein